MSELLRRPFNPKGDNSDVHDNGVEQIWLVNIYLLSWSLKQVSTGLCYLPAAKYSLVCDMDALRSTTSLLTVDFSPTYLCKEFFVYQYKTSPMISREKWYELFPNMNYFLQNEAKCLIQLTPIPRFQNEIIHFLITWLCWDRSSAYDAFKLNSDIN